MTNQDKDHFFALLATLAEAFGEPITAARTAAYWAALEDLPIGTIRSAVQQALRSSRFFPRPVELRELAGEILPDGGLLEALLVEHLRQPDGERRPIADPFLRLVVQRLGGLRVAAGMEATARQALLQRVVPPCVQIARVEGIPLPRLAPPARPRLADLRERSAVRSPYGEIRILLVADGAREDGRR